MTVQRYSKRTIDSYIYWIKFLIIYHQQRRPDEMHDAEVKQFLAKPWVMSVSSGVCENSPEPQQF
jgi:hypothetical protein